MFAMQIPFPGNAPRDTESSQNSGKEFPELVTANRIFSEDRNGSVVINFVWIEKFRFSFDGCKFFCGLISNCLVAFWGDCSYKSSDLYLQKNIPCIFVRITEAPGNSEYRRITKWVIKLKHHNQSFLALICKASQPLYTRQLVSKR